MGSLKEEMKGVREDQQLCEKTDDGEHPGVSGDSAVPERPQINISQEDCQPKLHVNASYNDDAGKNSKSKDQVLSAGGCDSDSIRITDCAQADAIIVTQEADETTVATHKDATIASTFLTDGDAEIQKSKNTAQEKEKEVESITMPVPPTPDPFDPRSPDPRSPAPFGQHHVRTQVSLEVVQCRSAATSPMTPPEGKNSFFFPSSFGRSEGVGNDTKDAELQVGKKVEFCSVATSPMTPKTPSSTAFPELVGRETVEKEEKVKRSEEQRKGGQQESCPSTPSPAEAESEKTQALKFKTEDLSPESSASCPAAGKSSQATVEDSNQPCKQQRMGSMDQDITILVTQYGNNGEEDEEAESSLYSIEPEMVKIDECEELSENKTDIKMEDGNEMISTESVAPDQVPEVLSTNRPQNQTEESSVPAGEQPTTGSEVTENKGVCEELKDVTKPPVPESPAPFGCHNIRTQVSLEVVQCQSAATSPMTPPEGEQAFYFPSSFGKCRTSAAETQDAELQVGRQVELRSVATAPMTPRTPITTTFPEIRKEASIEEKIVEEEEDKMEQDEEDKDKGIKEEKKETEQEKVGTAEEDKKEETNCKEKGEDKCEEPVQEVSWDEKGMTWEVYGAVVEVAVLGSAIQKHLEKQVKKQKRQPSMPPPPPLTPSATPLTPSESTQGSLGSGKGQAGKRVEQEGKVRRRRRNPFRLLMENVQQPHCCSRAHNTE
ncbi:hypothetical protein Q5P01_009198 [Channa striata]|uniref:G protein-regulated inducer of neurite outgrowth C-terminal domain-containing protein n=1 Tax=Channa striata TaxID=64152 RepID=A0AA88SX52_CHASR|nr:hypothetical protein Q5P01_009198 [Channa striata]